MRKVSKDVTNPMLRISLSFQAGMKNKRNAPIKGKNNTQRRSDIMEIFCFVLVDCVCISIFAKGSVQGPLVKGHFFFLAPAIQAAHTFKAQRTLTISCFSAKSKPYMSCVWLKRKLLAYLLVGDNPWTFG